MHTHPLNDEPRIRPLTPREAAYVLARVRPLLDATEEHQLADQERDLLGEGRQPYEAEQQLAEMLVRMAHEGYQWVDRPWANEARACWQKIETGTYEPEPPTVDALAQNATVVQNFDPWSRHAEIHDPEHVQTIGPRRIVNEIDSETGAGVLRLGGDAA